MQAKLEPTNSREQRDAGHGVINLRKQVLSSFNILQLTARSSPAFKCCGKCCASIPGFTAPTVAFVQPEGNPAEI